MLKKNDKEREKGRTPLDCEQKQFSGKYRFYKNWWMQLIRKAVGCLRPELGDTGRNKFCMPWKAEREERKILVLSQILGKVRHPWDSHLHSILLSWFFSTRLKLTEIKALGFILEFLMKFYFFKGKHTKICLINILD